MQVQLPKELRGTKFSQVLSIELNDFDINRLLPGLFFLVVADGYGTASRTNEDNTVEKYLENFFVHQDLEGFEGNDGKVLLDRLIRTTLITTSQISAGQQGEKVATIKAYSLLAFKTADNRWLRKVDVFVYRALKEALKQDDSLKARLEQVFGKGVNVTYRPQVGGQYDGKTELDTLTRLSIMFLDGFQSMPSKVNRDKDEGQGAYPTLTRAFAEDILSYLLTFYDLMPTQAFMHYLQGLLSFELFIYTLKVVYAINELVLHPKQLPDAMQESYRPSPPQIYLDFTGEVDGESVHMAKACVKHDIEAYQQFFTSNLLLKQLSMYVNQLKGPRWQSQIEKALQSRESGPLYLQGLLELQQHPSIGLQIEALAIGHEDDIRKFNYSTKENREEEEELPWLDVIADIGETGVERVVALLGEAQKGEALKRYLKWFWNVGGSDSLFKLLDGRRSHRASWKYAPTNELLSALVQLAATRIKPTDGQKENDKSIYTILLQDFLEFLETRFGILIDRPPDQFEGVEYAAAARENLRAMLRRLRQMGIFRDLSDDFTTQHLHPPYAGEYLELVEGQL